MKSLLRTVFCATLLCCLTSTSTAAVTSAFGGAINCSVDPSIVRTCSGTVNMPHRPSNKLPPPPSSAMPIDVNLFLPPAPLIGTDGNFPIIGIFHGWGGAKLGLSSAQVYLDQGYAVLSMSDRGWGNSCGALDSKRLASDCATGHNRLMDSRYEVYDAQYLFGLLADEGIINPAKIGVTGSSYGGGISMALAALKNRQMPVDYDAGDELIPWVSPNGIPMNIAAAAPDIPWSDLAYSLQPNGRTLDYVTDASYFGPNGDYPVGVMKQSYVSGFFALGIAGSNYAPPGTDTDADLFTWYSLITAGEPYDQNPLAKDIVDELTLHHSSYYIENSVEPAPLLISNGFTDDIFPPDEAIRYYNKTIDAHPNAHIQLYFTDHGHARGQNKAPEAEARQNARNAWFAYFLKGEGTKPSNQATVWTQACGEASVGPISAASWAELPQSEIVFSGTAAQIIAPNAADPTKGQTYDPIAGSGACAKAASTDTIGFANYRLPPAPAGGYTLLGSPTVVADILSPSPAAQIAARLLDINPETGDAVMVARGIFRPDGVQSTDPIRMVFQLHPNAYHFKEGHVAKLELMPNDIPYSRASNGQLPISIGNLELRLPILESTGTAGSAQPLPKFVPAGHTLAPDYRSVGVDSDGDGIDDPNDACPSEAGPASTDASKNGCPLPAVDSDNDGIPDANDACPNEAGTLENAGCPANDTDGDGILNNDDNCPGEAGPASTAGCPDQDGDGTANDQDQCPSDAGSAENSGCPADGKKPGHIEGPSESTNSTTLRAGQSGKAGSIKLSNQQSGSHTVNSFTLNVGRPGAFTSIVLRAANIEFTCERLTAGSEFNCTSETAVVIAPQSTLQLDVIVTRSSGAVAMLPAIHLVPGSESYFQPHASGSATQTLVAASLPGALLVLLLGLRRRKAAFLIIAGALLVGCNSDSSSSTAATQALDSTIVLTAIDARNSNNQSVDYGLPENGLTIGKVIFN